MTDRVGGAPSGAPPADADLGLAQHVKAVAIGHDTILLDLRRDKYLCAPSQSFDRILSGAEASADHALHAALQRDGLLATGSTDSVPRAMWRAPRLGATPIAFAVACLWARQIIGKRRLDLGAASLIASRQGAADPASAVARFLHWRVWYPARNICLFDSFALSYFLASAGAGFELVFGVRTQPFAAHCWVEWGGDILNDETDYCRSFTEIMRV